MSWETLATAQSPPMCTKAGYRYVYEWVEDNRITKKKTGEQMACYRWWQNGI